MEFLGEKFKEHLEMLLSLRNKPACIPSQSVVQGSKFWRNFVKFGNFGGGRKKNPKFCNTLIHVLYNFRLNFLLFILHIFVFNRCVVINHTNICLDLNVFLEKAYFMCQSLKKIRRNFGRISRNSVVSVMAEIFAIPKLKTLGTDNWT